MRIAKKNDNDADNTSNTMLSMLGDVVTHESICIRNTVVGF